MNIGVIGLGKMGGPIAKKFRKSGCDLIVYDINPSLLTEFENLEIQVATSIEHLSSVATIIWIMVSQSAVDSVLEELCTCTKPETVLIDGGNSYYKDTIRRADMLRKRNFHLLDCGTSGGLWGAERGFSLTVGGERDVYQQIERMFPYIAASEHSYQYVGPSGAGHYVKMVHNGIEYALMQAYAEGFHLLHEGAFPELDLAAISHTWQHGAVIRSWLLELIYSIYTQDQSFDTIDGKVGQLGTAKWAVKDAHAHKIPVKLIEDAVKIRTESQKTGGNYATKLIALIRHKMGGHPVAQSSCAACKENDL